MAGKLSRSFQLVKESFAVLKKDKELMLFPVVSGGVTILLLLSFFVPAYFVLGIKKVDRDTHQGVYLGLFFLYYFFSYFIVIFFNTGLIACAYKRLTGGTPTFSDGLSEAFQHIGKILVWALVSATVGMILRWISDESQLVGKIVVALLGAVWSLLTFFVIPAMIFENRGVFEAIKESGGLFKKTWGENVLGQVSISMIFFMIGLVGVLVLGVLSIVLGVLTSSVIVFLLSLSLVVLYVVLLAVVSSSLHGIFTAALYHYASAGAVPEGFSPDLLQNAFQPKAAKRGWFGR